LEESNYIRLLEIYRGHYEDPIKGSLMTVSLPTSGIAFYALSYTWANPLDEGSEFFEPYDTSFEIILDDCRLPVTRNLRDALLRFRHDEQSLIIWVDAICINQNDDKEKEDQIPLMAEIYARALRVVWLGEAKDGYSCCHRWFPFSGGMWATSEEISSPPHMRPIFRRTQGRRTQTTGDILHTEEISPITILH
jgi:hypothetical protein